MKNLKISDQSQILKQIDACVSCGLCLDVCPTYKVMGIESESPRGRLSTVKGMALNEIAVNKVSFSHLDHCLMCGACETVCPAKVEYSAVMDKAKSWLKSSGYNSFYDRVFSWLVFKGWRINLLSYLIFLYKRIGFQKLFPINSLKPYLNRQSAEKWREYYPVAESIKAKGDVYLFKGCVASIFDQDTIESSIFMLNKSGFNVIFPKQQACCGAVASHSGDSKRSAKLRARNIDVFTRDIPIIVTSTGCFASVSGFSMNVSGVYDIMEFIPKHFDLQEIQITNNAILSHIPCSQKTRSESVVSVRNSIQAICSNYIETDGSNGCCGSAGTYMYRNRALSNKIVDPIVQQILSTKPAIVVTQNIGCRMQLMNQTGKTTKEIMHPITLLYQNIHKNL